jgi:DNA-binding protein H-NS
MRQINLEKLSLKDLQDLELRVEKAIAQARMKERAELKAEIEQLVADRGFMMSEIFSTKRGGVKGRTVAPKFANPEDPSQTWTGRGRKPNWLVEKIKQGASLDDFVI